MTQSTELSQAIRTTIAALDPVTDDLHARPDYVKDEKLRLDAASLSSFKQSLLNYQSVSAPSTNQTVALSNEAQKIHNPLLTGLFENYTAFSQMGQLNTSRTIPPKQAKACNVRIKKLQDALQILIAQIQAKTNTGTSAGTNSTSSDDQKPTAKARIMSLEVPEAIRAPSGLFYQTYNESLSLSIRAVTDPDSAAAWNQVTWTGGEADASGIANWRSIPLKNITPVGQPLTITASANGTSQSVKIAIVPDLLNFDVSGAMANGGENWSFQSDIQEPVVVRAVIKPDTPEAYKWLKWTGGKVNPKNPDDRRLISPAEAGNADKNLPVEVDINVQ